jgi:hypothetical protein
MAVDILTCRWYNNEDISAIQPEEVLVAWLAQIELALYAARTRRREGGRVWLGAL